MKAKERIEYLTDYLNQCRNLCSDLEDEIEALVTLEGLYGSSIELTLFEKSMPNIQPIASINTQKKEKSKSLLYALNLDAYDSTHKVREVFSNEGVCQRAIGSARWGSSVKCPHCNSDHVYKYKVVKRGDRFQCRDCKEIFTYTSGTMFHSTKVSLPKWFLAIFILLKGEPDISTHKLARELSVTQKTAWMMVQRIKEEM